MNAVLKVKLDYKRSELLLFVKKIEELAQEQMREIERAIINQGKFKLREMYQFMAVREENWFRMSQDAQKAYLKKFHSLSVIVSKPQLELSCPTDVCVHQDIARNSSGQRLLNS